MVYNATYTVKDLFPIAARLGWEFITPWWWVLISTFGLAGVLIVVYILLKKKGIIK
jgi:hypothetical protein